jgi:hypothetical protein
MSNFFRKIRKKSLAHVQLKKYFFYAGGEILLVVSGILIALSINNWNEERKVRNQERAYLISLKEEFSYNLSSLESAIKLNEDHKDQSYRILQSASPASSNLTEQEFDQIFLKTISTEMQYRPRGGVVSEILNSGKLDIFDTRVRNKLASWEADLLRIRFQEEEHSRYRLSLFGMTEEDGNLRNLIHLGDSSINLSSSEFEGLNVTLLQSREFENLLVAFYVTAGYMTESYYLPFENSIQEALFFIEERLKALG